MTFVFSLIIIIILTVVYIVKLNHDLIINKDNILRSMAALDAVIIKKNVAALDLLSYAQEFMEKESNLIKELFNLRHDINKIKPKVSNAPVRYQYQAEFERKFQYFLNSCSRSSELNKNAGFQKSLAEYQELSRAFDERVDFYNTCVEKLNWSIHSFPSSILAKMDNTKEPPPPYQK